MERVRNMEELEKNGEKERNMEKSISRWRVLFTEQLGKPEVMKDRT